MISSGYEELEHTADIALRAWGENFFSLLKQSAEGMYDLMGIETEAPVFKYVNFRIKGPTREIQLVDFLNELLYIAEDEAIILKFFNFQKSKNELDIQASGYKAKSIQRNIKAVTFHDLEVIETDAGLETKITFDV